MSARRSPFEGERAVACVQQCENPRKRRSNDDDVQPLSRTAYCLLLASLSVDGDLSSPFETEICVPIHTFYLACDRDGVATRPQVITNLVHLRYGRIRTPGVALTTESTTPVTLSQATGKPPLSLVENAQNNRCTKPHMGFGAIQSP